MRPSEVVRRSADLMARHGVESPRETAETLLMSLLRTDRAGLYSGSTGLDPSISRLYEWAVRRRCAGTPLQHLTGEQGFMSLTLSVRPGVFIPRPETEGLVECAVDALARMTAPLIVDVGAGSGAVALALKHRFPDARVLASDVMPEAVDLASFNSMRLDLPIEVYEGDLLDPLPGEVRGSLDLLISNPPYVRWDEYGELPYEVRKDPREALVGGTDFHRRLAEEAGDWVAPGGLVILEIGADQGKEVAAIMRSVAEHVEVIPDLAGRDRVVKARLPAR